MREIVLDTETTGLNHRGDDRIVEIGCVELINHMSTGQTFHTYVNPQRDMPDGAFRVHGLSEEFLLNYPIFSEIVKTFLDFISDSQLIIHNAEFDIGFINAELKRVDMDGLSLDRAIDTVKIARRKFPGASAGLDALCRRFNIDLSDREFHGALKDARLLADVYLELIGGRQQDLNLAVQKKLNVITKLEQKQRAPRKFVISADESATHTQFLNKLDNPIWSR